MTDRPTCGYLQCTNPAEFYGPLWSALDHNETYPSYSCPEHAGSMAIVRVVGWPVNDQPPGFPIYAERPAAEQETP